MPRGNKYTRHTEKQKLEAVMTLAINAGSLRMTSRELGIPFTTLAVWRDKYRNIYNEHSAKYEEEVAAQLHAVRSAALERIIDAIDKASAMDAANILGVVVGIKRLLDDKPTVITQTELEIEGAISIEAIRAMGEQQQRAFNATRKGDTQVDTDAIPAFLEPG